MVSISDQEEEALREILGLVYRREGTDFSTYRRSTVVRRVRSRSQATGAADLSDYLHLLEQRPEETGNLIEALMINVSSFYRYPRAFDLLRERVIPELASQRESLRVWSAGCGKGEEAYTLALLLEEAEVSGRVEATDLDEKALALARKGLYRHSSTKMLPEDLYRSYLQPVSSNGKTRLSPTAETRRRVRFSKGDLTSSNPAPGGGEFDLVLCRNVLIYLGREAQESMLQALARSVRPGGYLCLGEAEWLVTAEDLFEIVDSAARIFRRGSHEQE